jgi:hypothetical protein
MDMGYEQQPVFLVITTLPPLSRYPLRYRHKTVKPFMCKLLPLPMNEFTSALFAVIASIMTSDIDRNTSVTFNLVTDPFGPLFPETILVSGIHSMLILDLHYDIHRHLWLLVTVDPGTPSYRLFQWKSHLRSAYILYIDTAYVHTIADVRLVIYEALSSRISSVVIAFTKDDAQNCISAAGLPQLYFDQFCIMRRHIENTVLAVLHKAITGFQIQSSHLAKTARFERLACRRMDPTGQLR